MEYRTLGRTGLRVSALSLGTVELGVDYGIAAPGAFGRPDRRQVQAILERARQAGINLFDTAPAYGDSERLLGEVLGGDESCLIATKVSLPRDDSGVGRRGAALRQAVAASLERSSQALRRKTLDIVQIHNATLDIIKDGQLIGALLEAKNEGRVRFLGASVYTEAEALAVIQTGSLDVLQVAYNLLDQRMASRVFETAQRAGVGLLVRSALLKGALTDKAAWLPAQLDELRQAAARARDRLADGNWSKLPEVAVRFCLSARPVATVLVGARSLDELEQALLAERAGSLSPDQLQIAHALALTDDFLLNPSHWPVA